MKLSWLSILFVVSWSACGGKTGHRGSNHRRAEAQEQARTSGSVTPGRPGAGSAGRQAGESPHPGARAPESPTTLAICDEYLDALCRCAREQPDKKVLQVACDEARKSIPKWRETSAKNPEQREAEAESCRKALAQVQKDFGCGPGGRGAGSAGKAGGQSVKR